MGIGGAGMSALALVARRRGVAVSGCDPDPSGASDVAALGAEVVAGHDPAHVTGARAVIVTAAVKPDHPELQRARELGVPVVPRKEALAALVSKGTVVGIAGTHGKSTTTVMTTEALTAAGLAPTGLAGGRVNAWGGNAKLGDDQIFVVESDEYDKAFLTLSPAVAVLNNVEADHLECYGNVQNMEDAFAVFAGRAQWVLAGADDEGAQRVAQVVRNTGKSTVWSYGFSKWADFQIGEVSQAEGGSRASIRLPDGKTLALSLIVHGVHNVRNATAAIGAAYALKAPLEPVLGALATYSGLGRRFERLGEAGGFSFVDDYAHHPTELVATLAAARQAYPGRRLVAVFQPHLYSRTAAHGRAMGEALAAADVVLVTEIYAAREQPVPGVTGASVAESASKAPGHREVVFEPNRAQVGERIMQLARPGDLILTM
ncbi:MAG TPA: UDP-N-acetylmuramate--L-alanine ligase, partial [Gemmatimonadales bacterium]|nr:UDP-N-acetylmuramate--L-alanine ligase [Gemmatimonadales bacterium]